MRWVLRSLRLLAWGFWSLLPHLLTCLLNVFLVLIQANSLQTSGVPNSMIATFFDVHHSICSRRGQLWNKNEIPKKLKNPIKLFLSSLSVRCSSFADRCERERIRPHALDLNEREETTEQVLWISDHSHGYFKTQKTLKSFFVLLLQSRLTRDSSVRVKGRESIKVGVCAQKIQKRLRMIASFDFLSSECSHSLEPCQTVTGSDLARSTIKHILGLLLYKTSPLFLPLPALFSPNHLKPRRSINQALSPLPLPMYLLK